MKRGRIFGVCFALALAVRLAAAAKTGRLEWLERSEVEVIALNLVSRGEYSLYASPTAHATPAFPLLLALVFKLLGAGVAAQAVNASVGCVVSAVRCGLVPLVALDAGLGRVAAWAGGVLSALYIGSMDTELSGKLDGPYVGLALLLLFWAAMRLWRSGEWQRKIPWGFFGYCGFCGLLNPCLFPPMAGLFAAALIACPAAMRKRLAVEGALCAAIIVACLVPWAIRNEMALGKPIFTRSNFGLEFWVSNGPGRSYELNDNVGDQFHPSGHREETEEVARLGEVEYNREHLEEALDWVRENPGDFLELTAKRIGAFWFPPYPAILIAPKAALTLMAWVGLCLMFRRQRLIAWMIAITWLTFPDVYYLVQFIGRYRTPMDWQLLLCAALVVEVLYEKSAPARRKRAKDLPATA